MWITFLACLESSLERTSRTVNHVVNVVILQLLLLICLSEVVSGWRGTPFTAVRASLPYLDVCSHEVYTAVANCLSSNGARCVGGCCRHEEL